MVILETTIHFMKEIENTTERGTELCSQEVERSNSIKYNIIFVRRLLIINLKSKAIQGTGNGM